jgi:hypothetical protein
MKYLVEIIPESIVDLDAAISKLAAALKLEPAKAAALLKRNPVTKPVSLAEAEKVAKLFNKAGIEVFVQNEEEYARTAAASQPQPEIQPVKQADSVPVVSKPVQLVTEPKPVSEPPVKQQAEVNTVVQAKRTDPGHATQSKSVVPETEPAHLPDPFQTKTVQGGEPMSIPSGFFTPVPEEATVPAEGSSPDLSLVAEMAPSRSSGKSGGLGKIAFASIVPGLLALLGIGAALYLVGLPFLRTQEHTSATTTAVALANSLGGWIGDVSLDNPALNQQVQTVINRTQSELSAQGIDLVLLTDAEGNQLAGWYKETQGVPETLALSEAVKAQISAALAVATTTGESANTAPARLTLQNEVLSLASAAVRQGNGAVGAVVVGRSEQPLMAKLQGLLPTLGLAGVLPFVLGMIVSFLVGKNR